MIGETVFGSIQIGTCWEIRIEQNILSFSLDFLVLGFFPLSVKGFLHTKNILYSMRIIL